MRKITTIFGALALAACVQKTPEQLVTDALREKNYAAAFPHVKQLADRGEAKYQGYVGKMYYQGEGTDKDVHRATSYFCQAGVKGDPGAVNNIAYLTERGDGVTANQEVAEALYDLAAQLGNTYSQWHVGFRFWKGKTGEPDLREAYKWLSLSYRKSSTKNDRNILRDLQEVESELTRQQIAGVNEALMSWKPATFTPDMARKIKETALCRTVLDRDV